MNVSPLWQPGRSVREGSGLDTMHLSASIGNRRQLRVDSRQEVDIPIPDYSGCVTSRALEQTGRVRAA